MTSNWPPPIVLHGKLIKLVPLALTHEAQLREAAADGKLWELWYTSVPDAKNTLHYIKKALQDPQALAFAVIDNGKDRVIGCTRYCNSASIHRRLEIGYTWYATSYQRTGVNTECKLLMLSHAFETLDCIAVEFRTNWFNFRSRTAIERLGAKQDGVLRSHKIDQDGLVRDTVVYSIIASEWQAVKKSLQHHAQRY